MGAIAMHAHSENRREAAHKRMAALALSSVATDWAIAPAIARLDKTAAICTLRRSRRK
jgi:hypothetical protein